ncbi:MAG: hypothetical protein K1X57_10165 [Gemmataceae bacterium]|nr:hypothetical protein [Gemmataceae bacterium]
MRLIAAMVLAGSFLGLCVAQPPRKEEEDPKAKTGRAIDIESFPPPKGESKVVVPKAPEGPGVAPASGTLVVGVRHAPIALHPRTARTDADVWALDLIYDSLVKPRATAEGVAFEPSLAAGISAEPTGRSFQIDPRYKWSDGTPVSANDVLATVERQKLAWAEASSDAPRRVSVALRIPVPDPASLFTFKILPAHRADDSGPPLGSGPYAFGSVTTQGGRQYAVFPMQPFASTRPRPPAIREVRFLVSPHPVDDLRRGLVDVAIEERSPVVFGEPRLPADVRIATVPSRRIYYLAINTLKTAFSGDGGRAMRRAVAFGIRREVILDEVWRVKEPALHSALTGPFPANTWPADAESGPLDDDALARAEVKAGAAPAEKLTIVYEDDDVAAGLACARIAAQLAGLGLPAEAKPLATAEYRRALAEKSYDLAYRHFDFRDEWFEPGELFTTAGSTARLDAALGRAAVRAEFTAKRDAYRRLHRDFRADMPFVPLWCLDAHVVLRRGVEAYPSADRIDPLHPLAEIDRWRVTR